ncbi:MAG TPA: hypothetical protein VM223_08020 [Planctomycetota bacterium]|nr:hypothetical protein [Planctomycetota bacterium]
MKTVKTDNSHLAHKLLIRRYFLEKYHTGAPTPTIFDCCQGEGVIWKALRQQFTVNYWGVDLKPRPGRPRVDSTRVLALPGFSADIIDIDTYGSPWNHWFSLLPNITKPVTVFMTIGHVSIFGGHPNLAMLRAAGLTFHRLPLPPAIGSKLRDLCVSYCLTRSYDYDIIVVETAECIAPGNARYLGLRLEKRAKT